MKTVMKKMFSLLLVAVLLVSAVPVAFATDTTYTVEVQITGVANVSRTVQAAPSDTVYSVFSWVANQSSINAGALNAAYTWNGSSIDPSINIQENGTLAVTLSCPGHTYVDGDVITAATCTAAGSKNRICSICGFTTTATIDALGHLWGPDHTCTAPQTCTRCPQVN